MVGSLAGVLAVIAGHASRNDVSHRVFPSFRQGNDVIHRQLASLSAIGAALAVGCFQCFPLFVREVIEDVRLASAPTLLANGFPLRMGGIVRLQAGNALSLELVRGAILSAPLAVPLAHLRAILGLVCLLAWIGALVVARLASSIQPIRGAVGSVEVADWLHGIAGRATLFLRYDDGSGAPGTLAITTPRFQAGGPPGIRSEIRRCLDGIASRAAFLGYGNVLWPMVSPAVLARRERLPFGGPIERLVRLLDAAFTTRMHAVIIQHSICLGKVQN